MHTTHTAHPPRAAANWRITGGLLLRQRGSLSPTSTFSQRNRVGPIEIWLRTPFVAGLPARTLEMALAQAEAHLLYPRYRLGCAEDTSNTPLPTAVAALPGFKVRGSQPGDQGPQLVRPPARVKESSPRDAEARRKGETARASPCLAKPNSTERSESA